jgi:hypothetical protein
VSVRLFAEPDAPCATKRNAKAWAKVQEEIEQLKNIAPGRLSWRMICR